MFAFWFWFGGLLWCGCVGFRLQFPARWCDVGLVCGLRCGFDVWFWFWFGGLLQLRGRWFDATCVVWFVANWCGLCGAGFGDLV